MSDPIIDPSLPICACGCGRHFTPRIKGQQFIDRGHSNRRRDKPQPARYKAHPKRCGKGRAGIAI